MDCILGTNLIVQVGIIVEDIEAVVEEYKMFFGLEDIPISESNTYDIAQSVFRGIPTECRCKQAFVDCGQLTIELIQPNDEPSTWREALDKNGDGLHHIAFRVKDLRGKVAMLEDRGFEEIQQGKFKKKYAGHYSYIDTQNRLKFLLELLENFD